MPFKLTVWRPEPMAPGSEFPVDEHAFYDVNNVAAYIREHHSPDFNITSLYQLRLYASLSGATETSILFGDGTRICVKTVTLSSLRGPWLSSERGSTLKEIVEGWNRHTRAQAAITRANELQ